MFRAELMFIGLFCVTFDAKNDFKFDNATENDDEDIFKVLN